MEFHNRFVATLARIRRSSVGQLLVNAVTVYVGPGTQLTGFATNQANGTGSLEGILPK